MKFVHCEDRGLLVIMIIICQVIDKNATLAHLARRAAIDGLGNLGSYIMVFELMSRTFAVVLSLFSLARDHLSHFNWQISSNYQFYLLSLGQKFHSIS